MMLDESDDHVFEPNMSFSVEPNLSLYEEGFGLKMGDTVVCEAAGSVSMSELAPEMLVIN